MDYRVLVEKYFQGTTSREEEDALRRYLMEDDLPEDTLREKEMLLAMLQPAGCECCEAMDEISAMIDGLAVQEEQNAAVVLHKPAPRRALMRYLYSAMAVAAVMALLLLVFPYNGDNMQQPDAQFVAVSEPSVNDTVIEQPIVAENNAVTEDTDNDTDVKNDAPKIIVPSVAEPEQALAANVQKEKTEMREACDIYIGAVKADVQRLPDYDYRLNNMRVGYKSDILKGVTAMTGANENNKDILKRRSGIYLRGGDGFGAILCEPPIKTDSVLSLSDILAGMKINHFSNPADAARLVGMRDSISAYSPEVEMMLQVQHDKETVRNGLVLTMDDVVLASEDFPWNPASPLRIYSIHNEDDESVITFLCSVCFRSQSMPFNKDIYALDEESGDIYNVLGYVGGHSMEQPLVVNGCSGRNILISLRFPKLKRNRGRISICIPCEQGVIKLAE